MRAVAAGVTDVGRERDQNEDRFVLVPECDLFVVADGMGGHQCGEVASRMATSIIASLFRADRDKEGVASETSELLRATVIEANTRIHRRAKRSMLHRGMGTTVVAAAFNANERRLHLAHAGDSRCYRLRGGELTQITRDHSLVEEALRARPEMDRNDLSYLPSNVITRALGVEAEVDVELSGEDVEARDVFLLCSDGLHGFVKDERLCEILIATRVLTEACAALIAEANNNGGGDNITAVVVRFEEVDEPWAVSRSVPPGPRTSIPPVGAKDADWHDAMENESALRGHLGADDTAKIPAILDPDAVLKDYRGR
ncbi:MAG: serine/threonine-protein phosphatase [Myxococcales bacterium]|nr:serine/threonine-protein phosphatase [Myxococcales bacterium]